MDALKIEPNSSDRINLLVFRNEKKDVVRYEEFSDRAVARRRLEAVELTWAGEVVLCTGKSTEEILAVYPEYRMREAVDGK